MDILRQGLPIFVAVRAKYRKINYGQDHTVQVAYQRVNTV